MAGFLHVRFILLLFGILISLVASEIFKDYKVNHNITSSTRFLIYDVNHGEGFNLRRDVYVRAANVVRSLIDRGEDWVLVLQPWRHLYHWKSRYLPQEALQWKSFFDLQNMNLYVPVMEFTDFLENHATEPNMIDEVMFLERHPDNFKGGFKEMIEYGDCEKNSHSNFLYSPSENNLYKGWFWGMKELRTKKFSCVKAQGHASVIADFLKESPARSILVDRFEVILHTSYGSVDFYEARRSLVFAHHLRQEGDEYRFKYLNSTDINDKTPYHGEDWRKQIPEPDSAVGGPYIGVHMRRGDFANGRKSTIPSVQEIGEEVEKKLAEYQLDKVYVSTDGTHEELDELQSYIKSGKVYQMARPKELVQKYKDGGIAIIDQWIVAHARYFLGTCESTFTFRIQEERDILGFAGSTTFNCLCGKQSPPDTCHPPSSWRVKFA